MATPANTDAALEEPSATVPQKPVLPHGDMAEIVPSLPMETPSSVLQLRPFNGCWLLEQFSMIIPTIHSRFKVRPSDVILASYPKSGTTWLKALSYATLNRATHSPFSKEHPLRHSNPHDCVSFLDIDLISKSDAERNAMLDGFEALHSPRLLATHLPYSLLPEAMAGEVPGCRIVYICRNPKDVLVSELHFLGKLQLTEAFEEFCAGRSFCGPYWCHVLQYWEQSSKSPDKVLFVKYEDMVHDPKSNLKKLAEFMGCAFSKEEEERGVVDAIVELCSLRQLKNMEVNKHGYNNLTVKNEKYFRKGGIGDWRNHLTPDMAERMDKIVEDALQGSGFTFADN
ncbi:hypothetical protein EJB05_45832, partial [Eragrostis curvula]